MRARAIGAVETEGSRLEFIVADLTFWACVAGAVSDVVPEWFLGIAIFLTCFTLLRATLLGSRHRFEVAEDRRFISVLECRLNRIGNAR